MPDGVAHSDISLKRQPPQQQLSLLYRPAPPPPPPLQPCPLLTARQSASPSPTVEPIDYSLKGRARDRSRSRSPVEQKSLSPPPPPPPPPPPSSQQQQPAPDSEMHKRASRAAEVIRVKLEGHGRRVHLFLAIILHSSLLASRSSSSDADADAGNLGDEEAALGQVAVFCDDHRRPVSRPSQYFLVLNTQLLALIWCKFKGNSSSEFSTLTRAIRSSRQKYRGIFESVGTPCKKLYKFGSVAMQEFQLLFPQCYPADTT